MQTAVDMAVRARGRSEEDRVTPTVTIHYNDSSDSVAVHHGVGSLNRKDRIELMRSDAEKAVAALESEFGHVIFTLKPHRLRYPMNLLDVVHAEGLNKAEAEAISAMIDAVNFDLSTMLDAYPYVAVALSAEDIPIIRRLAAVSLPDEVAVMTGIDRVMMALGSEVSVAGLDLLVELGRRQGVCGGEVKPYPWRAAPVGFIFEMVAPSSLALVAHEAAHVLHILEAKYQEGHPPFFVPTLRRVIRLLDPLVDEVRAAVEAIGTLPEVYPGVMDGGRWRMSECDCKRYALWRCDDVALWGEGAEDGVSRMPLEPDGVSFVRRCLGSGT